MKKILSLVLAMMMVLSMTSVAFAGTFEDVTDATQAKAIDALAALGIINGYDDGTYKPEKLVTRAEMAKILVVALGYESIANDIPAFADSQNHWAKGYIALASDLGIVQGRGNGVFDPDATVTYQEAAVMMLRALGYTDLSINNGKSEVYNAGNYKTKALALKLVDNIKNLSFNNGANRGDIALMLFANLTNDLVDINPTTGLAIPVADPSNPGQNKKLISKLADRETIRVELSDLGEHTADLSDYLFETVVVYKVDSDIIFVERSTSKKVEGYLSAVTTDAAVSTIKLNGVTNVSYSVAMTSSAIDADNVDVVYNGKAESYSEAELVALKNAIHNVKVVYNVSGTTNVVSGIVIEEVNDMSSPATNNDLYVAGRTHFMGRVFPTDADSKPAPSSVVMVGVDSFADIQKGDIVQYCNDKSGKIYKVYVTRETVEGGITKIDAVNGKYYVDGVAYELNLLAGKADPTLSIKSAKFYLDKDGNIANYTTISTGTTTTTSGYGVILGSKDGSLTDDFGSYSVSARPQVKIASVDGTVKVYDIAVAVNADGTEKASGTATGFNFGITTSSGIITSSALVTTGDITGTSVKLVKYTLNADGVIVALTNSGISTDSKLLKATSPEFVAKTSADTKVVAYDSANDVFKVLTLEALASTVEMQYIGTTAWSYVILPSTPAVAPVNNYAVVKSATDVLNDDDEVVAEVVILLDGVQQTFLTDETYTSAAVNAFKNQLVKVTFSKDVITGLTTSSGITPVAVTATSISSTVAVVDNGGATEYPAFASDLVVYRKAANGVMTISSVDAIANEIAIYDDASIIMYDDNGDGVFDVIVFVAR